MSLIETLLVEVLGATQRFTVVCELMLSKMSASFRAKSISRESFFPLHQNIKLLFKKFTQ